jgi:putative transposase
MIKGRPPRLQPVFDTYDAPLYFVTACTLYRRHFPSLQTASAAFVDYARRAEAFNIAVGSYVIMPDHLHLFVGGDHDFTLSEWVKGLKRSISNAFRRSGDPLKWQPGFFDHLLRNDESYSQKLGYVRDNPVRAGLVTRLEDWPFSGEIVHIDRA